MNTFPPSLSAWFLILAPFLGLLFAWLARTGEGTTRETLHRRLALGSLILVGVIGALGAAMVVSELGPGWWLSCGAMLGMTLLTATWGAGGSHRAVVW